MDLHFADAYVSKVLKEKMETGYPHTDTKNNSDCNSSIPLYIAWGFTRKSYREQSILIAESSLLQRFCMVACIDNKLKVPTKSTLQRFSQFFQAS